MVLGLLLLTPAPGLAQVTRPDLVVTVLGEPPATALPGDSFEVRSRVQNPSAVAAGVSITRFDLVRTPGGAVKNLKGGQNIPDLAPGIGAVSRVTLQIYSDTLPGTYFLRACANGKAPKIPESNTTNNCRQSTGTITVPHVPDLAVTAISFSPINPPLPVAQGQSFDATYTVTNTGGASALASLVKFYLVPTVGTTKIDLKTKDPEAVGALGPGGTFTNIPKLTVRSPETPPETPPGTYFLQACADSGKTVTESHEDDNCKTSVGTVEVKPAPDLFVKNVTLTGPLTVEQGEPLAVQVLVRNAGPAAAPSSTVKLVLVSTAVVPPGGTPRQEKLGTVDVPPLIKDKQVRLDVTPVVDELIDSGSYIVQACADYDKAVAESFEKNNCATALGTVTVTGLPLSAVDLEVTTLTPPPATRLPGQMFPLTATVRNHGTEASPSTTSKFYLVNALVNPTLRKNLKGVQTVGPLAMNATNATEVSVQVFPDTVPGSYFLQACSDGDKQLHEINESDNCRTSPTGITVSPVPDLVVTQIGNPPATILPGKGFPITQTVKNEGPVGSLASVVEFTLVSTGDPAIVFELNGSQDVPALALNGIFDGSGTVTVRQETAPGSYFVKACADAGRAILEGDEDDNCKLSTGAVQVGGVADLFINPVRLPPLPVIVARGSTILLGAVVRNQGLADAGASSLRFSLVVSPGAAPITKIPEIVPVGAVAQGARRVAEATVTIPADTPPGTYLVQACVDTAKVVVETSDANNCDTSDDTIQVTL